MSEISKGLNSGRKGFLGGSDSSTIMGTDLTALHRLWREKRGEAEPEDRSGNLTVQLGKVTEDLNRRGLRPTAVIR
jgi:predicted phage-related endonuclease